MHSSHVITIFAKRVVTSDFGSISHARTVCNVRLPDGARGYKSFTLRQLPQTEGWAPKAASYIINCLFDKIKKFKIILIFL